jgi:hypothetical protein
VRLHEPACYWCPFCRDRRAISRNLVSSCPTRLWSPRIPGSRSATWKAGARLESKIRLQPRTSSAHGSHPGLRPDTSMRLSATDSSTGCWPRLRSRRQDASIGNAATVSQGTTSDELVASLRRINGSSKPLARTSPTSARNTATGCCACAARASRSSRSRCRQRSAFRPSELAGHPPVGARRHYRKQRIPDDLTYSNRYARQPGCRARPSDAVPNRVICVRLHAFRRPSDLRICRIEDVGSAQARLAKHRHPKIVDARLGFQGGWLRRTPDRISYRLH